MISEHFNMPNTPLVIRRQILQSPVWSPRCLASEHSKEKLSAEEKAAFSLNTFHIRGFVIVIIFMNLIHSTTL